MKIGNFDLQKDGTYIIAELSANHNGSLQTALETIKAAKVTCCNICSAASAISLPKSVT